MPDARGGTPFVRVAAYQRAATTMAGINGVSAAGPLPGLNRMSVLGPRSPLRRACNCR